MDPQEFKRILDIGLGRAILFLQNHDARPYRGAMLDACLRNTAYDPQIEGSRAPYLRGVIALTAEEAFFRDRILAALASSGRDWDAEQLFRLAATYAGEGDQHARRVLYAKYNENARAGDETGETAIVHLDGLQGLLYVIRLAGDSGRISGQSGYQYYVWLLYWVEEDRGKAETGQALLQAARDDARIAAFVAAVDAYRSRGRPEHNARPDLGAIPYSTVKLAIAAGTARARGRSVRITDERGEERAIVLSRWGRQAPNGQLAQAAADLLVETDPRRLAPLLWIFQHRRFPRDHAPLLALARHQDEAVALGALVALRHFAHGAVRALALDLLQDTDAGDARRAAAVDLLIENHERGDYHILETALAGITDVDAFHAFGMGVRAVFAKHPTVEAVGALTSLYEKEPCSHCREGCVAGLLQLDALPDWIRDECRHDSSPDIRELVGG